MQNIFSGVDPTAVLASLMLMIGLFVAWAMKNIAVVREWFGSLDGAKKRWVIVGLCVVAGLGTLAGKEDLFEAIMAFLLALTGSQVGYTMLKKD